MKNYTSEQNRSFWISVMERLNNSEDIYSPIPEILEDTCKFFDFECGFIYQANHTGVFFLQEYFFAYEEACIPKMIDLPAFLGRELLEQLMHLKKVIVNGQQERTLLEERLSKLVGSLSFTLVPVVDQHFNLIAVVGVMNREDDKIDPRLNDSNFFISVLDAIAGRVKLQLYQKRIEDTQKSLESIMDNMGVDIYVNDFVTHEILYVNRSMAAPYGGIKNLMQKKCWQALYDDKVEQCDYCPQKKLIDENGNPTKIYCWDYQRPFDGAWFRVLSAAFHWVDGRLAHVVSSVDITENKRNEETIRMMAEVDELTGLANRRKLISDCDRSIQLLKKSDEKGYMIFFDLDGFKLVNDSLGHRAGDELLVRIGESLLENPMTNGRCYRNGGDEFVILCAYDSLEDIKKITDFLKDSFAKPWKLSDGEVICKASIGVTCFPLDATTTSELIHCADMGMYRAKQEGPGVVRFYNRGNICSDSEYYDKYIGLGDRAGTLEK